MRTAAIRVAEPRAQVGADGESGDSAGGLHSAIEPPFSVYQYELGASCEIDLFGYVRRSVESAKASLHAAREAERAVLLSMLTTADVGVAVASFYPCITLSGSFGLQTLYPAQLFNLNTRQYAAGPGIRIPIFQGGQLISTLHLRESQQKEAALNYQKTVPQAWHDVDNALTAYHAEQARRD